MRQGNPVARRPDGPRRQVRRRAEQDGHDDRAVPADRAERAARRRWATPAWRSPEGIESVYYNPASIGQLDGRPLQFTHSDWFADIGYDYAAVAFPAGAYGQLLRQRDRAELGRHRRAHGGEAAGHRRALQRSRPGDRPGLRAADHRPLRGRASGQLRRRDDLAQLPHDVHLQRRHGLPAVRPAARSSASASRTSAREPASAAATSRSSTTTTRRSYGDNSALPGEQYTDEFPVPVLFRVGLSYPYRMSQANRLLLAADALSPERQHREHEPRRGVDLEGRPGLRAGYQNLFQTDSELGLTLGVGLRGEVRRDTDSASTTPGPTTAGSRRRTA